MSVPAGDKVAMETHKELTQVITIVKGSGEIQIGESVKKFGPGNLAVVPAGVLHEIRASKTVKLYTTYNKDKSARWVH